MNHVRKLDEYKEFFTEIICLNDIYLREPKDKDRRTWSEDKNKVEGFETVGFKEESKMMLTFTSSRQAQLNEQKEIV